MMLTADGCKNMGLDEIQKRQGTPVLPIESNEGLKPARLSVCSILLSEAPRP
jgi:hypothetical protein